MKWEFEITDSELHAVVTFTNRSKYYKIHVYYNQITLQNTFNVELLGLDEQSETLKIWKVVSRWDELKHTELKAVLDAIDKVSTLFHVPFLGS